MRQVKIISEKEPDCLKELRKDSNNNYDHLRDECRQQVKDTLVELQQGLCAYCERKILPSGVKGVSEVRIEHYIPINRGSKNKDPLLELGWDNFLGVCNGKIYDQIKGDFCSPKRGQTPLNVDPRNEDHIKTIRFDKDANIWSINDLINNDLKNEKILNLNCEALVKKRVDAFDNIDSQFSDQGSFQKVSKNEFYRKTIKNIQEGNPEYQSFLLYAFRERLKIELDRSNHIEKNRIVKSFSFKNTINRILIFIKRLFN